MALSSPSNLLLRSPSEHDRDRLGVERLAALVDVAPDRPQETPDLRIRGRRIHPFRWTNIDTRYPRPYTPLAAIVGIDSVRIAGGVVTAGEGGRTTGERDAKCCKDRAQKNPTANHGCLVLSFLSRAAVIATSLRPLCGARGRSIVACRGGLRSCLALKRLSLPRLARLAVLELGRGG